MEGMTAALIGGAVVAVMAGILFWARLRAAAAEEAEYFFRCPGCRRRIRYAAKRVGSKGICPACHKPFVFPPGGPVTGGPRQ
jgi:hypothetical protein